jgi:hypothetical protein
MQIKQYCSCISTVAELVTVLKNFLKLFSYAETETLSFAGSIDNTDNLRYVFERFSNCLVDLYTSYGFLL